MKTNLLIASFVIFLTAFSSIALAAVTLTVSPSLSSKSLTENAQATLSVSVTNGGTSAESNIIVQLTGGWFSVVSDCSVISGLQASQTLTTNCIIKPTSTGSGLSLTATAESSGGNTGQGSESGITVSSQSTSLTAAVSAPSSVSTSATFYAGATVYASSTTDVTNARATISASGQCEVDTNYLPVEQSLGGITKGNSKSPTNWKLTSSSASGSCSISVSVVSDNAGNANPSTSVTVGTAPSAPSGGVGVTGQSVLLTITGKALLSEAQRGKATITIPSIAANGTANFSIAAEDLSVTNMIIKVSKTVSNVKITIQKLDKKPVDVLNEPSGVINQYFEVTKNNITAGDVSEVTISFKIEKSWLRANNINESTILLNRYADNAWNKLTTTKIKEDKDNLYFEAKSPNLSVFAVTGEKKIVVTPAAEKPEEKKPEAEVITKKPLLIYVYVIVTVAIIALVVFYLQKKGLLKKKYSKRI